MGLQWLRTARKQEDGHALVPGFFCETLVGEPRSSAGQARVRPAPSLERLEDRRLLSAATAR